MQIALVHNERAGDRAHSASNLVEIFRALGHVVEPFKRDNESLLRVLNSRPDAVVVAGGDGTVARVAIALCGSDAPMFVLPAGTANNIAVSIGAGSDNVLGLAEHLSTARLSQLDVWRIAGAGSEASFVEGAGVGVIGTMLERERQKAHSLWHHVRSSFEGEVDHWESTARYVAELLRREPVRWINVEADGHDLSGEYVTVEAMNIQAIGPRIQLAPRADPGDGWIELVLVTSETRPLLAECIESRATMLPEEVVSPRRVRRLRIDWPSSGRHVDDDDWPGGESPSRPGSVSIVARGHVKLLVPA